MRERHIAVGLSIIAMVLAMACSISAESMGTSGGHDLDRLWASAREQIDLSDHDAALLLESRTITLTADGACRTRVHRVVWIGTEIGIDAHADLRIPYNSATSTMTVIALRTWRDGKWWPDRTEVSPTAVVQTLPFALAGADDYSTMRETMLLHDGVELPCIMETVYDIEERGGSGSSRDGQWIFPQNDPAVLVEYILKSPEDMNPALHSGNGAPEPAVKRGDDGTVTYSWRMENVASLGYPHISDPVCYAPYIAWSTWAGWQALGRAIVSGFDEASVLNGSLADTLVERLRSEPGAAAKARKIADLVDEYTRGIHYESRFWFPSPRTATRTWETAYGHALDRAVLAAAFFRNAGLDAEPVYRSSSFSGIDSNVPGLSRFDEVLLRIGSERFEAFYDPQAGTLTTGIRPIYGRVLWNPASGEAPKARPAFGGPDQFSRLELILTIEPCGEGGWQGSGYIDAGSLFSTHGEMSGLDGETLDRISAIAGSMLKGIDVKGYNPETFEPLHVTAGFEFRVKDPDQDELNRYRFVIGEPAGGIMSMLPPDVRLCHEHRGSPVLLPGTMEQRVLLRVNAGEREIIYIPESRTLENKAGSFTLRVSEEDGRITIEREIVLMDTAVTPDSWPDLRALLLAETDPAGATVIVK